MISSCSEYSFGKATGGQVIRMPIYAPFKCTLTSSPQSLLVLSASLRAIQSLQHNIGKVWHLTEPQFAQELLSTFSTSLGEVALQPATGGVFTIEIYHLTTSTPSDAQPHITQKILWDRKTEGGFPEVKELKKRVRDCIDPFRDLGHVDGKKSVPSTTTSNPEPAASDAASVVEATSPTSHGHNEDEAQAHLKQNLEHQPGSGMHGTATPVRGGQEELVVGGKVDRDDRKRNVDGTVCEDCV